MQYKLLTLLFISTLPHLHSQQATEWGAETSEWSYIDWYGWISDAGNGWVYHEDHGWTYSIGQTHESIWSFDQELGWIWTGKTVYPHYYSPTTDEWIHYQARDQDVREFYALNAQSWFSVHRRPTSAPQLYPDLYSWRHVKFTESEEHELLSYTKGSQNVVTTDYDTQVIENDLLRITLLPGWGARILSIYYKPQDMELLSYAKGDKHSEVIYAEGAFYYDNWLLLPGGINPTFPEGEHGKYWGEVWEFKSIEETREHVTVRMSRTDDLEWAGHPWKFDNGLTGMTVDMDITVPRNRACVEISYTLTNNKNETIPYEFWMAAALAPLPPELTATSSNLEIIMKQEKIILRDWWNWMANVETDDENTTDDVFMFDKLAWLYNWERSGIAYAYPATDNPWWGVINHDYNWGVLRTIDDINMSPGMKIWGTGENYGMFELWSGNSPEFFVDAFLSPFEVKTWKEYFIPTVDLSAISYANSHGAAQAALNIGSLTGSIDLSVFSTWQPANWKLKIEAVPEIGEPQLLGQAILNFTPDHPTEHLVLPFPMDSLPAGNFSIEATLTDVFTGNDRMRFQIDH
jgi:hypothetical protein